MEVVSSAVVSNLSVRTLEGECVRERTMIE